MQEAVCFGAVGEFHVGSIPLEFFADLQGDVAQQRGFGKDAAMQYKI